MLQTQSQRSLFLTTVTLTVITHLSRSLFFDTAQPSNLKILQYCTCLGLALLGFLFFRHHRSRSLPRVSTLTSDSHDIYRESLTAKVHAQYEKAWTEQVKELERSNQDLEQFAYFAAHDLKAPLRQILTSTKILGASPLLQADSDSLQWVQFIAKSAKDMDSFIFELLSAAFVKNPGKCDSLTCVDLNEVIAGMNVLDPDAKDLISIEVGPLPTIDGHRIQLKQLFQNLMGNAIKFRRLGCPLLVKISAREDEHEWVIAIEDDGIGIAEEHHTSIFDLFHRLHHQDAYEGKGIGLAICKKAAELHAGRIWLTSQEGVGTTFYVALAKKRA